MNIDVFVEAFVARLVPIYTEVTLGAIRHFQFEQYPEHAALAAVGGLLALGLFYGLGIWLRRMPERISTPEQQLRIAAMRKAAQGWLPWLLILAPTPAGAAVVIAAGFFRMNPRHAWAIIVAAEILWRAMPYLR
jgi:membrane protein YqaA with SNARE-associated domain